MYRLRLGIATALIIILLGCSAQTETPTTETEFEAAPVEAGDAVEIAGGENELPVYRVTRTGLTRDQAAALGEALGIEGEIVDDNGGVWFASDRFGASPLPIPEPPEEGEPEEDGIPVVLEQLDFAALEETGVLSDGEALDRVQAALEQNELVAEAWGPLEAEPIFGHTSLGWVTVDDVDNPNPPSIALDTHVDYLLSLDGVPLIGPGAEIKAVLSPEGDVTLLNYQMRALEPGEMVAVMSPPEAADACEAEYRAEGIFESLDVQAEIVYYAPPLTFNEAQAIYPHVNCNATALLEDEAVTLRSTLIPAMLDTADVLPDVELAVEVEGSTIRAEARIMAGPDLVNYLWNSSLSPEPLPNSPAVAYDVGGPAADRGVSAEELTLVYQTADGITGVVTQEVALSAANPAELAVRARLPAALVPGPIDVGTDWIGTCQGLKGSAANAGGFASWFSTAGNPVQFNWGNTAAWERDFIDQGQRANGVDYLYGDNADFVFYTGHANGNGFTFCSKQQDGSLGYWENPRWGNDDLEWLVIAACGPLQLTEGGKTWAQRWGSSFDGLHLLMGYQTGSADNTIEGTLMALFALSGVPLRSAWAQTAIIVQGPKVYWAVMGVYGTNNVTSYNDHFWGEGSVSPDLVGGNRSGWWIVWGPS